MPIKPTEAERERGDILGERGSRHRHEPCVRFAVGREGGGGVEDGGGQAGGQAARLEGWLVAHTPVCEYAMQGG
jgi:hypothetical protein